VSFCVRPAPVPVSVFVTVIANTATNVSEPPVRSSTTVIEVLSSVNEVATALAGETELNTPKPKAATATSAMRLKVVFVDMCFLSISRTEEFPQFGLN